MASVRVGREGAHAVWPAIVALLLAASLALQPIDAAKEPEHVEFYMYIAVAFNNSVLVNPRANVTAVQSAQPAVWQLFSFGIIHTFDNPLFSGPSLDTTRVGRGQGWYGDVGQDALTLFFAETITYGDANYNGTFSILGVDVADPTAAKFVPVVGGTGDFAFAKGIVELTLKSDVTKDNETVSWFKYSVDFKY